jgi:hypothetical protein
VLGAEDAGAPAASAVPSPASTASATPATTVLRLLATSTRWYGSASAIASVQRMARACEPLGVSRWLVIGAIVLVAILGASQVLIPPLAEHRIEDRLTSGGGSADVSLQAVPAARLLFGDGKRISVSGDGLALRLQQQTGVLDKLDGFDDVDVHLTDFRAGPFSIASFDLTRTGSGAPYALVLRGRTTPGGLAQYGASEFGLPGGSLLRFLAGQALGGNPPIPIALDMGLQSDGGRIVVVSGGGTVAGIPTGPLAELITSAIVVQL